jgi:hypothetical protein
VRLEFDSDSAEDREKIARLYRHAHVVSHVTDNGRTAIEADVSRRVLDRLTGGSHGPAEAGPHHPGVGSALKRTMRGRARAAGDR